MHQVIMSVERAWQILDDIKQGEGIIWDFTTGDRISAEGQFTADELLALSVVLRNRDVK